MKKVIEKSQDGSIKFRPSESMLKYLQSALKLGNYTSNIQICKDAGIDQSSYTKWCERYGIYFKDWFYNEYDKNKREIIFYLDMIGLHKAKNDFSYWQAMMKRYGALKDEPKGGVNVANIIGNNGVQTTPAITARERAIIEQERKKFR